MKEKKNRTFGAEKREIAPLVRRKERNLKVKKDYKAEKILLAFFILLFSFLICIGCASKPKVKIIELENKGTIDKIKTPAWVSNYVESGIPRVQKMSEFKDKYVVIGEESGVNRQFVVTWADNFSAQQRIGAMLRTTIVSEYSARIQGEAQSTGLTGILPSQSEYNQAIDSIVNAVVNVSYSGAIREADWWSLRRRYDPDIKDAYTDEYTAYVLYTIPKQEMNRQVAYALETSVRSDSALYDVTIEMARLILQEGFERWGEE